MFTKSVYYRAMKIKAQLYNKAWESDKAFHAAGYDNLCAGSKFYEYLEREYQYARACYEAEGGLRRTPETLFEFARM